MDIIVSIITINYNGLADTCTLLDSISFTPSLEVIVVDNASKEDEATTIEQRYPEARVLRSKRNLGFAGGNNLGILASHGKYLFFINNDTFFKEDGNIQALVKRLESSDIIGAVCPKIRFSWGNKPIQYAGYTPLSKITMRNHSIGFGEEDKGQYDKSHPTPYAHGAAMMVKRETIEKAGLMPDCYFLYYEELDWSVMITRAGYEIWFEPSCTIYHKESRSTGINSPLKSFYITRNRLLFTKRNNAGLNKHFSYIYLIGIVGLKDIMKHLISGNFSLAISIVKGISSFFNIKQ